MRAGLLNLGAAMLSGRGNFGNVLGQGLGAGVQGYQGSIQQQQKDQMEAAQLKLLQGKEQRATTLENTISSAFGGSQPPQPGGAVTSGQVPPSVGLPPGPGVAPIASLPRSGKFPLTLDQVALIKASGGPDLSAEYKMAHEGFERKQGSTYEGTDGSMQSYARLGDGQVQAPDGSVSNARGYVGALAETEGAKATAQERAKAGYDLLPLGYVGEDGRPMGGTRGGYIAKVSELPKVGAPPARAPMKSAGPAGFPVVTPAEQKQRDGTRLQILQDERAKIKNPADLAAIDREIAGAGGRPVLQSAAEAKAQVGAVDTQMNAGNKLNDNWITNVHNPVQAEGKAAKATLSQLETLKHVNFQTGWGAEAKAGAANILASLGVKDAAKYAGDSQKFQQVAMEKNMVQLAAQAGPQTEGDSQRAQQTFVMLKNTPAANQFIADLTGANAAIAAKKADYYNRALPLAKASGDLTEIDRRWSKIAPSVWADPKLAKYKGK